MNKTTKNLKKELKPCPFCGGKAEIKKDEGQYVNIKCTQCPCDMGRYWFTRQTDAIKAWNRRFNNGSM